MGLRRLARGAARRAAAWPLRALPPDLRAEVLADATADSIVESVVPGGRLHFYAPTPLLRSRANGLLLKEPDMIAWLDALPAEAVLWDVGANVGVFSLYAARCRGARVLAFEPSAANFFVLTRNIQLNVLGDRIASYCLALSGATELGVLNLDSPALGTAMTHFGPSGEASRYSSGNGNVTHGMLGMTIDDFMQHFSPPCPTHLKIDVDGLEGQILQGARRTLADPRLKSAMIELSVTHVAEREAALALLEACGLHYVSQGGRQGGDLEAAANHLFQRR